MRSNKVPGAPVPLKVPLIILTLSDPGECTKSFFNRVFHAATVQKHSKFKMLQLNLPTDALIDKVLRQIVSAEGGVSHLTDQ